MLQLGPSSRKQCRRFFTPALYSGLSQCGPRLATLANRGGGFAPLAQSRPRVLCHGPCEKERWGGSRGGDEFSRPKRHARGDRGRSTVDLLTVAHACSRLSRRFARSPHPMQGHISQFDCPGHSKCVSARIEQLIWTFRAHTPGPAPCRVATYTVPTLTFSKQSQRDVFQPTEQTLFGRWLVTHYIK